jgi:hypothetical protein
MKTIQASIVFCLLMAAAPAVRAQPAPKPDAAENEALSDKARQLFAEGVDALKRGRWAEGHASFLAAWRIKPHYQVAANLGATEVNLGKYRDAAEHLSFYLREAPKTKEKERQRAQALLDDALSKVASVTLIGLPDGAEVKIDGAAVGRAQLVGSLFLEPGEHSLEVRLEGFAPLTQALRVGPGEAKQIAARLERPAPPAVPVVPVVERRPMWPAVVSGALAVGGLAAGVGFLVGAGSKATAASNLHDAITQAGRRCTTGASNYDARCTDVASVASTADTLHDAGVGLLIGAGAAATGAVMYLLWPQRPRPVASVRSLQVAPVVATTGAGLVFQGTF